MQSCEPPRSAAWLLAWSVRRRRVGERKSHKPEPYDTLLSKTITRVLPSPQSACVMRLNASTGDGCSLPLALLMLLHATDLLIVSARAHGPSQYRASWATSSVCETRGCFLDGDYWTATSKTTSCLSVALSMSGNSMRICLSSISTLPPSIVPDLSASCMLKSIRS